jgi:general L-amino acid transport system permease protein
VLAAVIAAIGIGYWRSRVFIKTGAPHHRVLWGLGTLLVIGSVAYLALGGPVKISRPTVDDAGRIYEGGIQMQMPYAAMVTALVLYTATHISEIVRGSIQAVHKGQVEASEALALSGFQRYRFVILPQAMRIAFPPLINQFLNFSKNSSLALLIGFGEITSIINNLAGQSQPAPQLIFILMLLYLVISLVLSMLGNLVNRKLQIVGR